VNKRVAGEPWLAGFAAALWSNLAAYVGKHLLNQVTTGRGPKAYLRHLESFRSN